MAKKKKRKHRQNNKNPKVNNDISPDVNKIISSNEELKQIVISAIQEEKEREKKEKLTDYSMVMLIIIGIIYGITYFMITCYIYYLIKYTNINTKNKIYELISFIGFDLIIIGLAYSIFNKKNMTNNNVNQHFSLLTTIVAIFLALFSLR